MTTDKHYVHDVWGDTEELAPPPGLSNPLVITDYEVQGTRTGPDGQTIKGYWDDLRDISGRTEAPGDKAWRVVIDGNGGDVWLRANQPDGGAPQDIDFSITVQDARNVRITGLEAFVGDIRTVNGHHPDHANNYDQLINIKNIKGDGSVFVEGTNIDMNWGGKYPTYRTDAISAHTLGTKSNPIDSFTIQNSRITGIASDLNSPKSHADAVHIQPKNSYIDYFNSENVFGTTKYQFYMMNYDVTTGSGTPGKPQHSRFYNTQIQGEEDPLIFLDNRKSNYKQFMSLEFDDTYLYVPDARQTGLYTSSIYNYKPGDEHVSFKSNYLNARSNIQQADGDRQSKMVSGEQELHIVHNRGRLPDDPAPANATGTNYTSMWSQDGALLDEVLEVELVTDGTSANDLLGWYDKVTGEAHILFTDVNKARGFDAALPVADLDRVAFFLVPDGGDNFTNGGALKGVDPSAVAFRVGFDGLRHVIETTDGVRLEGRRTPNSELAPLAFFTETKKNSDGFDHAREASGGKIGWETAYGGGDRDFNDVVIRVSAGAVGTIDDSPADRDPVDDRTGTDAMKIALVADGSAGDHLLGWYDKLTGEAEILFANVNKARGFDKTVSVTDLDDVGFFLVPDGGDNFTNGGALRGVDPGDVELRVVSSGGRHVIETTDGVQLEGRRTLKSDSEPLAFFTQTGKNPNGFDYAREAGGGKIGWETTYGGGDRDFDDVVIRVTEVVGSDGGGKAPSPPPPSSPPAGDNGGKLGSGTGLDVFVTIPYSDPKIAQDLSASEIAKGVDAIKAMNDLLVEGIVATGIANDGTIGISDIRDLSDHLTDNHRAEWAKLHGDNDGGTSSGFHILKDARNGTELFGEKAINSVADNIYHLGFGYRGSRLVDEDGALNAPFSKIETYLNELLDDDLANGSLGNPEVVLDIEPSTGTGLDRLVEIIQSDAQIERELNASEIAAGAKTANVLNALIVEGIVATDIADDRRLSANDIGKLSDYLRSNHRVEWVELVGDNDGGKSSGFHALQESANATTMFGGVKAINGVADKIYNLGFGSRDSRLIDEDGKLSAPFEKTANWLGRLLADDLADGSLANLDPSPIVDEAYSILG